jgi:nitrogen fixation protein FixH
VSVLVKNDQGQPIENADVRYEARHTGMGHGGVSATAENRGSGRYEGAMNFSMTGDWSLGVNVRLPGNNTVFAETIRLGVR